MIAKEQVPLNESIIAISSHYGFKVNWDVILEKWIIKSPYEIYTDTDFYWSSEYTFEDFLDSLKTYFKDMGYCS